MVAAFVAGIFVGFFFGVLVMCIVAVGRDAE